MINPQAGAYVGNSLYLKCLMYTCVISTYILNILTYVQINLRVIPNSLSIQTTSQQLLHWSTLVLSPMALSLFLYRVYVTRCHRVSIDRSSRILAGLNSTAGWTCSVTDVTDYMQTTKSSINPLYVKWSRPDYSSQRLPSPRSNQTPSSAIV